MNTERFFEGPGSSNMTTYIWEIAIILLVAFILGYVLRHLLNDRFKSRIANLESELNRLTSKGLTSSEVDAAEENNALQERIKEQATEIKKLSQKLVVSNIEKISLEKQLAGFTPEVVNKPQSTTSKTKGIEPAATNDAAKDNLKKIEGIGPKIEQLLNNDGIYTYQDLISASVSRIRGVLIAAGPNYPVHDPSTWAEQASLANTGMWEILADMQEQLKGGKRK